MRYVIYWEPDACLPFQLGLHVSAAPWPVVPHGENEVVWWGAMARNESQGLVVGLACVTLDQSVSLVLSIPLTNWRRWMR